MFSFFHLLSHPRRAIVSRCHFVRRRHRPLPHCCSRFRCRRPCSTELPTAPLDSRSLSSSSSPSAEEAELEVSSDVDGTGSVDVSPVELSEILECCRFPDAKRRSVSDSSSEDDVEPVGRLAAVPESESECESLSEPEASEEDSCADVEDCVNLFNTPFSFTTLLPSSSSSSLLPLSSSLLLETSTTAVLFFFLEICLLGRTPLAGFALVDE